MFKENKKKIGISIYPEHVGLEKTIEYIKDASGFGIKRIFANFLNVKNDAEGKKHIETQTETFRIARDLGYEVILDVNPSIYKEFNLENTELQFFKNMNASGIRLDLDFGGEVEKELSLNNLGMMIELNASSGTETVDNAIKLGANTKQLMTCHNFYPMKYTGLKYDRFIKLSQHFTDLGMRVGAFVTLGDDPSFKGPWTPHDGMPTIELQRYETLFNQIKHLMATPFISDIIISQHRISMQELVEIKKLTDSNVNLIFNLEDENSITENELKVLEHEHFNRPDVNDYFIRSTQTRVTHRELSIPQRIHDSEWLMPGEIFVNNDLFQRYKGELQIITKKIPNDGRRNYVGRISKFDHNLIEYALPGRKFKILRTIGDVK